MDKKKESGMQTGILQWLMGCSYCTKKCRAKGFNSGMAGAEIKEVKSRSPKDMLRGAPMV